MNPFPFAPARPNSFPKGHEPGDGDIFARIATAIEQRGYAIEAQALPPALTESLFLDVVRSDDDDFRRAGIGRQDDHHLNRFVRTDQIRWIEPNQGANGAFLAWMENLRLALNRRLFLGLFDYEAHFARYEPGAYYKRHLDAFAGRSNRVLSTVLYLNPDWQLDQGGELLIYPADDPLPVTEPIERLLPRLGTLVVFLSEVFPHEVLPASRTRHSIAGWFRINNNLAGNLDPPR